MQFVHKLRKTAVKLLNLRLVDRRKHQNVAYLVDASRLSSHMNNFLLTKQPITIGLDSNRDNLQYNLYTRVGLSVQSLSDGIKIVNPM